MAEKTKKTEVLEPDYKVLWENLKAFVTRQTKDVNKKWQDKTAPEVWEFLDLTLSFWEVCQTKNVTSWGNEEQPPAKKKRLG